MSSQIKLIYGFILFLLLLAFSLPVSATIQKNNHSENDNTARNLYLSLKKNNLKAIYHYLSVYQQEHQADPLLIIFSQAKLAYLNQRPGLQSGYITLFCNRNPISLPHNWNWPEATGLIVSSGTPCFCSGN
ncbi:hypothetical protein N6Y36_17525 [Morganella morganii]|nr:hypothetical protein N6Y36_17525 [Morganella morganii]